MSRVCRRSTRGFCEKNKAKIYKIRCGGRDHVKMAKYKSKGLD